MITELAQGSSMYQERWLGVMYDVDAVDGDLEILLERLQKRHGYSRKTATAELLRKLSQAAP